RNIWRTDLDAALARLAPVVQKHQGALWLAPSCSLLHVPFSLAAETALDPEVRSWLAFAVEKLGELRLLASALTQGEAAVGPELAAARAALAARHASPRAHRAPVAARRAAAAPN